MGIMQAKLHTTAPENPERDSVYPYKIAAMLAWGHNVRGFTRLPGGCTSINYKEFKEHMGRSMRMPVEKYLHILKGLGILAKLTTHKSYALVWIKPVTWTNTNE